MTHPRLELTAEPSPALRETVQAGIRQFNGRLFQAAPAGEDLSVAVIDEDGRPVGGVLGRTAGGWLAIDLIFVPEAMRGAGLATRLIAMAEDEARRRGCHAAWLDTLNPDALRLYRKLGYTTFGELADYPVGFTRHFLQKKLVA
jgi:GNAT superfamily N-acetyltransferase